MVSLMRIAKRLEDSSLSSILTYGQKHFLWEEPFPFFAEYSILDKKEKSCMQRKLSLLLALVLALGCCLPAALAEAGEYPTQWDLTKIYSSADEWQADYDKVIELIQGYEIYRGKLVDAPSILDYIEFTNLGDLTRLKDKLFLYADLGYSLNPSDSIYSNLVAKLTQLGSIESRMSAFSTPEIYALPLEKRQEIFSDPLLAPYAYALRDFVDPDYQHKSEDVLSTLAVLSPAQGRAATVFDILNSVDLPNPVIVDPDGNEIVLTEQKYLQIAHSDKYDRDFKGKCNEKLLTKYEPYVNTFAALLEANAAEIWAFAQIDNHDSSREAALDSSDVDPAIYDFLIAAAHKGAPDYRRYLSVHKRGLKLDEQYPFDMSDYVSDYSASDITYDMAVKTVREALSVLGEDYLAIYDEIIASGQLDVYPTGTKVSGAFSTMVGNEFLPYMLFNFAGIPDDVNTLAHEMGHSIYSYLSTENQNALYRSPTIFTHEVASITNELLYFNHMMNTAADDEEKLFYIENMLSMFSGTFFMQALYAEFEDTIYKTVEAGESLNAETISDLWRDLYLEYRGDGIKTFPNARYQWAAVPHFYYNYYVYQYATSVSYAASLCTSIMNGEEGAVEAYKNFLTLGNSQPPAELLKAAGIDPLDEETYQKALDYYGRLVDEYERLVDAKLAANK